MIPCAFAVQTRGSARSPPTSPSCRLYRTSPLEGVGTPRGDRPENAGNRYRAPAVKASAAHLQPGSPLGSPEVHARFGRKVELVSRFHIKRLVPSVHIAHGAINTELRRAVRVREHALARGLLMRLIAPDP